METRRRNRLVVKANSRECKEKLARILTETIELAGKSSYFEVITPTESPTKIWIDCYEEYLPQIQSLVEPMERFIGQVAMALNAEVSIGEIEGIKPV